MTGPKCGFCGAGHPAYRCTSAEAEAPITIDVTVRVTLPAVGVWPDGPPTDWTTADVIALLQDHASLQSWASEWSLTEGADVTVTAPGRPASTGMVW